MLLADIHPFESTISVFGAIAIVIAALALFFKLLARASSSGNIRRITVAGVLGDGKTCDVILGNGKSYERVKIVGVTDSKPSKGGFPWELHGMMILEHEDGSHTLVQAKLIKSIEVPVQ